MTEQQKTQISELHKGGYGYSKISQMTGVPLNTVKSFCKRAASAKAEAPACLNCGTILIMVPGKKKKKFCSDKCRLQWWNAHQGEVSRKANYEVTCQHCGKTIISYGYAARKYCSRECYFDERYGR